MIHASVVWLEATESSY